MHSTLDLLRPRSWTVRVRSAVASTVVVAVCLVIAGGALLGVLYNSLENSARSAAAARGLQVAEQLESDTAAQIDDSLLATDGQIGIIQVIDGSGTVRAQSRGDGAAPVTTEQVAPAATRDLGRVSYGEDGGFWVTAQGATSPRSEEH